MNHRFTPDQAFSLDLDYLYFFHNNPNIYVFNTEYLQDERREEEELDISKKTPLKMWVGKIDYQHRLSKNVSLKQE